MATPIPPSLATLVQPLLKRAEEAGAIQGK